MNTALESYIEWLKSNIKIAEEYQLNNITLLNVCLENAERFLPMEKEQIMDAYYQGDADSDNIHVDAEDYYNETFKSE